MKNTHSAAIKKGWVRSLIFLLIYISLYQLTIRALEQFLVSFGDDTVYNLLVNILVMAAISLAALVIALKYIDRKPVSFPALSIKNIRENGTAGALLAICLLGTGSLILYLNQNLIWTDIRYVNNFLIYIFIFTLVAFYEELIFRGYILNNLMDSFNKWLALCISALIFAIFHLNNPAMNWISMLNVFAGGIIMGLNFIYTRNLWFAILFHLMWNFIQGPVLGFKVSGIEIEPVLVQQIQGNELISGGSFGFEGSVIQTILFAIAILLLIFYYEYRFNMEGRTDKIS